ncbi:MAG: NifB/NifX family molybdenum-iron cluster-binding protein [Firmicutes bacterium]|nr:NifB/NifX family molybdenum-iron cluster-binding protein [Bacillota bacterium]
MKVAVTSQGTDLDATVDERFGRCHYFILIDPENEKFEVVENLGAGSSGGAGVQAAQFVAGQGAKALITGHIGPKAMEALEASDIEVYSVDSCSVREALARYKNHQLKPVLKAMVGPHFGTRR